MEQNNPRGSLPPEALRLREETALMRYDSAVRRLFTRMPGDSFDPESFFADTGVRFSGPRFFAAEFEDDPGHPSCPPENVEETAPYQRYRALRDLVLSILGREHPAVLCNQNGRLACVVNWQGGEANWHGSFSALVDELNRALWERMHFRFQCVVSRMYPARSALPQAERELAEARRYRRLMGGLSGEILFYDGILRTTGLEEREAPPGEDESARNRDFLQALLRGDAPQAKEILHCIVAENFILSRPAVQFVQLRMFTVIDYVLKSLNHAAEELGLQQELAALDAAPRLLAAENVWKLEETAGALLDQFQAVIGENGLRSRLPFQARTYIREHYGDPDLNVNKVADVFHVTPTYATRAFKQQFGCGILSYIQQVRVEQAKRLLNSTRPVKEIAQMVGFSTPASLIRSFKKWEGTTPAQFSSMTGEEGV